jgi:hypothetical protein
MEEANTAVPPRLHQLRQQQLQDGALPHTVRALDYDKATRLI